MHLAWVSAGFDPARFWQITMKEADREFRGALKRRQREADERMSLAWHIVALDRTERLPRLQDILSKPDTPKRAQTGPEMLAAMKGIFFAFGGDPEQLKGDNDQHG